MAAAEGEQDAGTEEGQPHPADLITDGPTSRTHGRRERDQGGATGDRGERGEPGPVGPALDGLVRQDVLCRRDEILIGAYCQGYAVLPSVTITDGIATVGCMDLQSKPAENARPVATRLKKP
ncbi:hypothetical protein [Methylobacterium sp. WL116]|uniref:hypothetical protein n=1 Tax=Methylobacterium sp. WL116 TaxID=2603889 RepID=UPI001FF07481|nr:hypothetical protein [Methylobacterium sp. WL116]